MLDNVLSGDKKVSLDQWAKKEKIDPKLAKALIKSLEEPDEVPYLMDTIVKFFKKLKKPSKNAIRNALIRIQIYCSIHSNSDPIKLSKQLYISQTFERVMFGYNMLMETPAEESES